MIKYYYVPTTENGVYLGYNSNVSAEGASESAKLKRDFGDMIRGFKCTPSDTGDSEVRAFRTKLLAGESYRVLIRAARVDVSGRPCDFVCAYAFRSGEDISESITPYFEFPKHEHDDLNDWFNEDSVLQLNKFKSDAINKQRDDNVSTSNISIDNIQSAFGLAAAYKQEPQNADPKYKNSKLYFSYGDSPKAALSYLLEQNNAEQHAALGYVLFENSDFDQSLLYEDCFVMCTKNMPKNQTSANFYATKGERVIAPKDFDGLTFEDARKKALGTPFDEFTEDAKKFFDAPQQYSQLKDLLDKLYSKMPSPSSVGVASMIEFLKRAGAEQSASSWNDFAISAVQSIDIVQEVSNWATTHNGGTDILRYVFPVLSDLEKFIVDPKPSSFAGSKQIICSFFSSTNPGGTDEEKKRKDSETGAKRAYATELFKKYPQLERFYLNAENGSDDEGEVFDLGLSPSEERMLLPLKTHIDFLFIGVSKTETKKTPEEFQNMLVKILSTYKDRVYPALLRSYKKYLSNANDVYLNKLVSAQLTLEYNESQAHSTPSALAKDIGEKNYNLLYTYERFVYNSVLYLLSECNKSELDNEDIDKIVSKTQKYGDNLLGDDRVSAFGKAVINAINACKKKLI